MNAHARGWRECQPEEKERIEAMKQKEMAKLDDELPRGGNPISSSIFLILLLCIAAIAFVYGYHIYKEIQEPAPVADVYEIRA